MENTTYRTGDSVPEDGTYKVVSRIDGGELNKDDTEIMIEKVSRSLIPLNWQRSKLTKA